MAVEYKMSKNVLMEKLTSIGFKPVETTGKKILVIRDIETALFYAPENTVVYVTDDPIKHQQFDMFTEADCGDDDCSILMDGTEFRHEHDGKVIATGIMKEWKNLEKILDLI